jgi:hypothetical protein
VKPTLNGIDAIRLDHPEEHELLSIILVSVFWRDLITNILPPGENGVVIVFENECNPSFTFEINGPDVVYFGQGDLHDTNFDDLGQEVCIKNMRDCMFFCL